MESDDEFRRFSEKIASDPIDVLLAKWRRDVFIRKLMKLPDVVDVIPSGSLARGTQIGPVHDVDLIVVFDSSQCPVIKGRSAAAAASAQDAITHLEEKLLEQLHPWRGAAGGLLKETEQRTHVVKYRGDWSGPFKEIIPSAPPVDVMPAVREGSHLLIPERETGWIDADPEKLIRQVEQRQRELKHFKTVAGMMKAWARLNHLKMKNLAVEVMVLKYCPRPGLFETLSCGDAITRLFEAAAEAADKGNLSLKDPAGRCGEIDPNMNYGKLRSALVDAAALARQAMDAEHARKHGYLPVGDVIHPDECWRKLFGKKYPRAKKRFWRAAETEPWFGKYKAEHAATADGGEWHHPPRPNGPGGGGPKGPDLDPDGPHRRPHGPGDRPRRPSGQPFSPRGPEPASAKPGTSLWTGVFGTAAAASVPLTFG